MEKNLLVSKNTEAKTVKKKNYPKSRKKGKRHICKNCQKGFLGRAKQETCSPACTKQHYANKKSLQNSATPKKRGRPKKSDIALFTGKNIKPTKNTAQNSISSIFNPFMAESNKHLIHAVVDSYHNAKLITTICQSVFPNIQIKIVKI